MLSSRGQQLLFADADGATKFSDISKLQDNLKQLMDGNLLQSIRFLLFGLYIFAITTRAQKMYAFY